MASSPPKTPPTESTPPKTSFWPPLSLDLLEKDFLHETGYVCNYHGLVYKQHCCPRELNMMLQAGDRAVRPTALFVTKSEDKATMRGLLMSLETPFDVKMWEYLRKEV